MNDNIARVLAATIRGLGHVYWHVWRRHVTG